MTTGVRLGYGLVTCQTHPDRPEDWTALYAEALDLAAAAEDEGLDSVWVSEHHFVDDGHLPSLLPLLAGMAARTRRVLLGTGVLLVPLHDPLRLLEDAAVVDRISAGRLVLGLGLGWRDEEFEGFGRTTRERVRRLTDLMALARDAWEGHPVEVQGGRARPWVTPTPHRAGGPPLLVGALEEPAVRRAGRIADGLMATEVTPEELAVQVGWARAEHVGAGRTDPFEVLVHLPVLAHPDGPSFADVAEQLRYPGWKYEDMAEARTMTGPLRRPGPATAEELERLERTSLVGTPAAVADRVRAYADAAGGSLHFVARSYLPGLGPQGRREALAGLGEVARLLAGDTARRPA